LPANSLRAAGATGGFAGGEKGLKQFIETGDVQLRDPRQPGKQFSPVAIAGLLVVAGAGGGLLLNELTDLGEIAVRTEITNVSLNWRSDGWVALISDCSCRLRRWGGTDALKALLAISCWMLRKALRPMLSNVVMCLLLTSNILL
jgi:hypothetical protein